MIRIAITAAACQAIAVTMPGCEPEAGDGERLIWLEPAVVNRLRCLRGRVRATPTSFCSWRRKRLEYQGALNAVATVPCHVS